MTPLIALMVTLLPTVALGEETCQASNLETCIPGAGREVKGSVLLQAIHTTARVDSNDVHEDDAASQGGSEEHSQVKESFDQLEKLAQALTERLHLLQGDNSQVVDEQR